MLKTRKIISIWATCISVLLVLSMCMLKTTIIHKELGNYSQALCKKCAYIFHDDNCEKCGNSIIEYGIFKDRSEPYTYDLNTVTKKVTFKDYFSSYTDYNKDYKKALFWSVVFTFTLISIPVSFILYFVLRKRKKNIN